MASLLFEPSEDSESAKLARLVDFFGISASRADPAGIFASPRANGTTKLRLLCSARAYLKVMAATERATDGARFWRENVHSAFVFACGDILSLQEIAQRLVGDQVAVAEAPRATTWVMAENHLDFCGSMSGLRVHTREGVAESVLTVGQSCPDPAKVVTCQSGVAVLKLDYLGVPVVLATSQGIVDLDAPLMPPTFDIRQAFLAAAPVVMYVKWAFGENCWNPQVTGACVVIDDPLLRPRYGFFDFRHFLDLMRAHNFSTNIAFIPWNWRRSSANVVRLFKDNADRFSLSIHGCDHTGAEFGSGDEERMAWKARQAMLRMARHESITGIPFDHVMVFPQGVFSENAMGVLKRSGYIGAVNSDVVSLDPQPQMISVGDYWGVAVMNYSSFPIYTRRYPSDGVENFAFDIILGKPCLIVIHHHDCRDGCRALIDVIRELNALNAKLAWEGLGQVVRHGYRQREVSTGVVDVEMFGSEVEVWNTSATRKRFLVHKRESEPTRVCDVRTASGPIAWRGAERQIAFELELDPGASETASVVYAQIPTDESQREGFRYRLKAMARRYLSEVRDNYLSRGPFSA